jgi:hypothetical protein
MYNKIKICNSRAKVESTIKYKPIKFYNSKPTKFLNILFEVKNKFGYRNYGKYFNYFH